MEQSILRNVAYEVFQVLLFRMNSIFTLLQYCKIWLYTWFLFGLILLVRTLLRVLKGVPLRPPSAVDHSILTTAIVFRGYCFSCKMMHHLICISSEYIASDSLCSWSGNFEKFSWQPGLLVLRTWIKTISDCGVFWKIVYMKEAACELCLIRSRA